MKEELKRKYQTYLARRKGRNIHSFLVFLLFVSLFFGWIFIVFIQLWGLVAWGVIILLLLAILKKTPTPPTEPPENDMFLKLYDTLRNIEFYYEDPQSEIHLTRACKDLRRLLSLIREIIKPGSYSMIVKKAVNEPLERLASNLEKRILPLICYPSNFQKIQEVCSRLESLAFIFAEPMTIPENLSLCNRTIEELPETWVITEGLQSQFKSKLSKFCRTGIGIMTISLIGGFFLILLGSLVYCLFYNLQFATFAHDNPYLIFLGGAGFSTVIGTILTRK